MKNFYHKKIFFTTSGALNQSYHIVHLSRNVSSMYFYLPLGCMMTLLQIWYEWLITQLFMLGIQSRPIVYALSLFRYSGQHKKNVNWAIFRAIITTHLTFCWVNLTLMYKIGFWASKKSQFSTIFKVCVFLWGLRKIMKLNSDLWT